MHKQSKTSSEFEILIPDCCNLGIVVRVLLSVNLLVLLAVLSRGQSLAQNFQEFVEASMLVELISLLSLVILCGFRRMIERESALAWMQRVVCGTVPAIVCFMVFLVFNQFEWFAYSFPNLNIGMAVLYCFCFGIGLQHYFEMRTRAFSPALGEARLQALQARIRPHFLFNSLNAVLSLIRTEPRRAETALEDLADLFRVLMRDTRNMSTLREEITLCQQYLAIEKIRLGERLKVNWQIENLDTQTLNATKIPTLLLQPLIENAIHYGVEPAAAGGVIDVSIQKVLDKIEIQVSNLYYPHAQLSKGNHMALDNIRQRLRLLYDIEALLQTKQIDSQFVVQLIFPVHI
ncbi:sensor histidine kinase [Undibacterium fentianense]|uniref:Histidine kinase n=1 Tax=Undibacterium fentianense TaxID=2828728 RepID=A0A941DYG3_9BURK|nr:histidine kinase [Undibacterium fentianense]MBR7799075.1 histidine kinase [Undibacterium fentianense]